MENGKGVRVTNNDESPKLRKRRSVTSRGPESGNRRKEGLDGREGATKVNESTEICGRCTVVEGVNKEVGFRSDRTD